MPTPLLLLLALMVPEVVEVILLKVILEISVIGRESGRRHS